MWFVLYLKNICLAHVLFQFETHDVNTASGTSEFMSYNSLKTHTNSIIIHILCANVFWALLHVTTETDIMHITLSNQLMHSSSSVSHACDWFW